MDHAAWYYIDQPDGQNHFNLVPMIPTFTENKFEPM